MIQFDYSSVDLLQEHKKYKLSSVFGEDNFFYGLFDDRTNRLMKAKFITGLPMGFQQDRAFLKHFLEKEIVPSERITYSVAAVANAHFTLLPFGLEPDQNNTIDSFSPLRYDNAYQLKNQEIERAGVTMPFYIPDALESALTDRFKENISIVHLNGALVKAGSSVDSHRFLLLNWLGQSIQTVVYHDKTLRQSNHYYLDGEHDALYFTLLNSQLQELDPLYDQYYLTGPMPIELHGPDVLKQHIKYFELLANHNRLNYANVFLGKPKHFFFDLQAVLECG